MDPIPDEWPPDLGAAEERRSPVVPMFPLPGVFLFPAQLMPLHVFEARYRQMVEDSLDGPGRLVMGTILEGEHVGLEGEQEGEEPPAVLPVAGLGEIVRHDKLPDGRFLLVLLGLCRVQLSEVASDHPYRLVQVAPLSELAPGPGQAQRLRPRLVAAVRSRTGKELELPEDLPLALLCDLLSQRMQVPQGVAERIFAESDVTRRAELALEAHGRYRR